MEERVRERDRESEGEGERGGGGLTLDLVSIEEARWMTGSIGVCI